VIWNANRGAISLRVQVFGKAAHVGLQHQAVNAFERMHRVVARLQALKHEVEQRTSHAKIGAEQARNSILMLGGQSGGGSNFNVVPENCWFTIDRRINPEEDLATEKSEVDRCFGKLQARGNSSGVGDSAAGNSASCDEGSALGQALARSIGTVTGDAPRFELCPGLLEIRFYATQGIPAYAYGPGLLSVAHGPNEYVDLRNVIESAAIYALAAIQTLNPNES